VSIHRAIESDDPDQRRDRTPTALNVHRRRRSMKQEPLGCSNTNERRRGEATSGKDDLWSATIRRAGRLKKPSGEGLSAVKQVPTPVSWSADAFGYQPAESASASRGRARPADEPLAGRRHALKHPWKRCL
jgi:hypothetical protein